MMFTSRLTASPRCCLNYWGDLASRPTCHRVWHHGCSGHQATHQRGVPGRELQRATLTSTEGVSDTIGNG